MLRSLYPLIEPYSQMWLDVGEGHSLHVERCGARGAPVALVLHGGPGGGVHPDHRRLFDPSKWDIVLFDQRGAGKSTPHASLVANTTWDLVADIERLRNHLGVERWLVLGGSWGSTLGLAYAETHPNRVTALILRGVFLCTEAEIDWFYGSGLRHVYPDKYEVLASYIPLEERHDLLAAYHRRMTSGFLDDQVAAAQAWVGFEDETATLLPIPTTGGAAPDPHVLAIARLEAHYFANRCWLRPNQLLDDAHRLDGIPGRIIHGRYDMTCPLRFAWLLHQVWRQADLRIVEGAGHAGSEPGIIDQIIRATDDFASA
ncbi:MAG: prolyl aminopeptidase [Brevundimonas sp.]|nr:MAG: prolyl aminopeptidase [Brevundimonas sp.]